MPTSGNTTLTQERVNRLRTLVQQNGAILEYFSDFDEDIANDLISIIGTNSGSTSGSTIDGPGSGSASQETVQYLRTLVQQNGALIAIIQELIGDTIQEIEGI